MRMKPTVFAVNGFFWKLSIKRKKIPPILLTTAMCIWLLSPKQTSQENKSYQPQWIPGWWGRWIKREIGPSPEVIFESLNSLWILCLQNNWSPDEEISVAQELRARQRTSLFFFLNVEIQETLGSTEGEDYKT